MHARTGTARKKWLILTSIIAVCATAFILPQLVFYPWRMVPNLLGDGGKNTFTYIYHILYDKGTWFSGMNYPYGEHIVFTDGQPLLSIPLGYLNASVETAFAAMGWLTALSYILSIIFCYRILSYFGVRPSMAIVFGILITVCTPQLAGIPGHYALAYSCLIPMLFYWSIQYHDSRQLRYPIFILVAGMLFSFLHPYYAAIVFVWVFAYAIGYVLLSKEAFTLRLRHVGRILLMPAVIFTTFAAFMKLTDRYNDRPTTPFSAADNYTTINKIFTSPFSPIWTSLKEHNIVNNVNQNADGGSYIGLAATLILIAAVALAIRNKIMRKSKNSNETFSPIWVFMALTVLIFSMGIPFVWHMEWLLDYTPFFKQFRTVARFSWIFYYIITVYSAVLLHSWFSALLHKKKVLAWSIAVVPALLWTYEANAVTAFIRKLLSNGEDNYYILTGKKDVYWQHFLTQHNYKPADFQAVLVLPYFSIGSEKVWIDGSIFGVTQAATAAIQLHLPAIDAMMSRTSWSVTEKQVKLVAGPYVHKPCLDDMRDTRPFLLINMGLDTADRDQEYLLEASDFIGNYSNSSVYACYPDRIKAGDEKNIAQIQPLLSAMRVADSCVISSCSWYINHLDESAPAVFYGSGALSFNRAKDTIAVMAVKTTDCNHMYEFSCWSLVSKDDYKTPDYLLSFSDSAGNTITTQLVMTKNSTDNSGLWFRAGKYFIMPANCCKVTCTVERKMAAYKVLDELQIRPADGLIISKNAVGKVLINNHAVSALP